MKKRETKAFHLQFMSDPVQMTDEECAAIYEKSWR